MDIRRLTPADADLFQALRLAALREAPTAFASSYEEEKDFPRATLEARLAPRTDRGTFGAFADGALIGIVVLGRAEHVKIRHKGLLWSLYVAPQARGKGVARALMQAVLTLARSVPGLRQVNVGVNAANAAALHLYRSLGFKEYGRESGSLLIEGVSHDELHLVLKLAH